MPTLAAKVASGCASDPSRLFHYLTDITDGGSAPDWTDYTYDALDRVRIVEAPVGAQVVTEYSGNTTTVTDPAGKKRRSRADAAGRVVEVVEDPFGLGYSASYEYDPLDNLAKVTQGGQVRTFVYDSVSRLKSASNPEQSAPRRTPTTGTATWRPAPTHVA
jgi:YD repeat-containing protein